MTPAWFVCGLIGMSTLALGAGSQRLPALDEQTPANAVIPEKAAPPPGALPVGPGGRGLGGEGDPKAEFPKLEDVVKDMKVREGFFTLYHDEKKDKLFARIPKKLLNKNFLLALSIARGPFFAGWQMGDAACYWDRVGKKIVLMEADPRYARPKGATVLDVIKRTYTDNIIRSAPILTEADGDVVFDLAELLKVDFAQVGELFEGRMDRGLSRFGAVKNFDQNTEIGVDGAMMDRQGRGTIARLHFSFSQLLETDYQPRVADARVGYFIVAQKDWSVDHGEQTIFKRYVNRWQLRKAEPDQEVSDVLPEDQIVFYIEKTVPVKYRQYVREGILEWNKAFEAVGLRNAVLVHQQTENNEFKDLDPEDVRYNFFRWIVSGQPFAMGPSRVNPFTGQILDADIIFDDSMVRYITQEYDVYGPSASSPFTDGPLMEYLEANPDPLLDHLQSRQTLASLGAAYRRSFSSLHSDPVGNFSDDADPESKRGNPHAGCGHPVGVRCTFRNEVSSDDTDPPGSRVSQPSAARRSGGLTWSAGLAEGRAACELGAGMTRQLAFASVMAESAGKPLSDEFIGQAIKETVMHEVGHTLGLRHNFKASSWRPLNEIKGIKSNEGKPTTASVMDYNPYTYSSAVSDQGAFASPTLGPYDYWAIEYGYKPFAPGQKRPDGGEKDQTKDAAEDAVAAAKAKDAGTDGRENSGSLEERAPDGKKRRRGEEENGADVKNVPSVDKTASVDAKGEDKSEAIDDPAKDKKKKGKGAKDKDGEAAMLASIASRCAEPGLAFATDEDTSYFFPDPLVNRWDNGDDPMVYARDRMTAIGKLWKDGLDWAVKDGESLFRLRRAFSMLLNEYGFVSPLVARMVAGQFIHRDFKGDPAGRSPMEPVSAVKQREALSFLRETVLSDSDFQFSPQLLNNLAPGRWGHWDSDGFSPDVAFDVHSRIEAIRAAVLFQLMNPFTLNRLYDMERMVPQGQDAFTVPELFQAVNGMVWSELEPGASSPANPSDRKPVISSFRRSLQRQHAQRLISIVLARPGSRLYPDVHAVARLSLKDLSSSITRTLKERGSRFDDFSKAHLVDTQQRVDRALAAEFVANKRESTAPSGSRTMIGAGNR